MNPFPELPVSAEVYGQIKKRITELEVENKQLREMLRKYELQFAATRNTNSSRVTPFTVRSGTPLNPSTKANLVGDTNINQLHEQRAKNALEAKEAFEKLQTMLDACQQTLMQEPDVEGVSSDDAFSFSSPLVTQESDMYPDDSFEA